MDRCIRSEAQKSLSSGRVILHVDFDSFFASCEQHFNPNLRGKPIGVTAENGRTCIIAASREAKKFGIKTGSRSWEAEKLCPEIILVKADFERYLEITKKFISITNDFSPVVEVFSLDEVFIDMTPTLHLYKSIDDVVTRLKKRMCSEISPITTVSVGVSYNKLLAKIATNLKKPDGFSVIGRSEVDKIYSQIELTDVCGIGERYKRRLNFLGIFSLLELRAYPLPLLKKEFGQMAAENLKAISLAQDQRPVISYLDESVTKSVGRNYCLPQNEHDQEKILKVVYELCEEIAIKLRRLGKKTRTVGLSLNGDGSMNARRTMHKNFDTGKEIFDVCMKLYRNHKWNGMVRQISVWATNLLDNNILTPGLFDNPKQELVKKVVDQINEKHGHHTVRNGFLLDAPKLDTKPNGYFADKWERETLKFLNV